jgi:cytochrome c-type biogenesis protein CcmH/NrfG
MATISKEITGYVKTESLILAVVVALALGFVGGVAFSAYRASNGQPTAASPAGPTLSAQQREQLQDLIEKTRSNPDDVTSWTQLGHLYFDNDQPQLAVDAYEKSLQLDDSRPDVWTDLGVMYRRSGDPRKAIEAFDHALSLNRRHEIAMFNKGVVLMHDLREPQKALAAWELLVQVNPQAKTPAGQLVSELVEQLKKTTPDK